VLLSAPTSSGKTSAAFLSILRIVLTRAHPKIIYVAPLKALVAQIYTQLSDAVGASSPIKVFALTGDSDSGTADLVSAVSWIAVVTPEKLEVLLRTAPYTLAAAHLVVCDEVHILGDEERGPALEASLAFFRQLPSVSLFAMSATLPNALELGAWLGCIAPEGLSCAEGMTTRALPKLPSSYVACTPSPAPQAGRGFVAVFGPEYRPVPVSISLLSIPRARVSHSPDFQPFSGKADRVVAELALKANDSTSNLLVFVHGRKQAARLALLLCETLLLGEPPDEKAKPGRALAAHKKDASQDQLRDVCRGVQNSDLRSLLPHGVAFHHAGLSSRDRNIVEKLFLDGSVHTLVSTATLAWGVNTPADVVVVYGTDVYSGGRLRDLSYTDVLQMIGRAGRPQYQDFSLAGPRPAKAYLILRSDMVDTYVPLLQGDSPVESKLLPSFDSSRPECDALTVELLPPGLARYLVSGLACYPVVLLRVGVSELPRSLGEVFSELVESTLFWRQAGHAFFEEVAGRSPSSPQEMESLLGDLGKSLSDAFVAGGLLRSLTFTPLGEVSSRFYLSPVDTLHLWRACSNLNYEAMALKALSLVSEFRTLTVSAEERSELLLIQEHLPYPLYPDLPEFAQKAYTLIQLFFGLGGKVPRFRSVSLFSDLSYIEQALPRLSGALLALARLTSSVNAVQVARSVYVSVRQRAFPSSCPLLQLSVMQGLFRVGDSGRDAASFGIAKVMVGGKSLSDNDFLAKAIHEFDRHNVCWDDLLEMEADEIEGRIIEFLGERREAQAPFGRADEGLLSAAKHAANQLANLTLSYPLISLSFARVALWPSSLLELRCSIEWENEADSMVHYDEVFQHLKLELRISCCGAVLSSFIVPGPAPWTTATFVHLEREQTVNPLVIEVFSSEYKEIYAQASVLPCSISRELFLPPADTRAAPITQASLELAMCDACNSLADDSGDRDSDVHLLVAVLDDTTAACQYSAVIELLVRHFNSFGSVTIIVPTELMKRSLERQMEAALAVSAGATQVSSAACKVFTYRAAFSASLDSDHLFVLDISSVGSGDGWVLELFLTSLIHTKLSKPIGLSVFGRSVHDPRLLSSWLGEFRTTLLGPPLGIVHSAHHFPRSSLAAFPFQERVRTVRDWIWASAAEVSGEFSGSPERVFFVVPASLLLFAGFAPPAAERRVGSAEHCVSADSLPNLTILIARDGFLAPTECIVCSLEEFLSLGERKEIRTSDAVIYVTPELFNEETHPEDMQHIYWFSGTHLAVLARPQDLEMYRSVLLGRTVLSCLDRNLARMKPPSPDQRSIDLKGSLLYQAMLQYPTCYEIAYSSPCPLALSRKQLTDEVIQEEAEDVRKAVLSRLANLYCDSPSDETMEPLGEQNLSVGVQDLLPVCRGR